tara:strand:+ start:2445 stop:2789 length:345 start_codon:yes stop_codon:yes gene_type:complete
MNIDYSNSSVPEEYVCSDCGVTNVKLWLPYHTPKVELFCAPCGERNQRGHTFNEIDLSTIDGNGTISCAGARTDALGWLVPAIPDEEGVGYWGYTSVPEAGVLWWQRLATLGEP